MVNFNIKTKDPFGDKVGKIYCDRKNISQFRKTLQEIKKDEYEAVIDFCAYKPKYLQVFSKILISNLEALR